jgi:hypothetical protein
VSSRLVRAASGRAIAVEITTPVPEPEVGYRFAVLGNKVGRSGFRFVGEPSGRPPLPDEAKAAMRPAGRHSSPAEGPRREWTAADRKEARRLQAEGLSWSKIAERVCGDKWYKPTVGTWLRA